MNRRSFLASLLAAPLAILGIREPAKQWDELIIFCSNKTVWIWKLQGQTVMLTEIKPDPSPWFMSKVSDPFDWNV